MEDWLKCQISPLVKCRQHIVFTQVFFVNINEGIHINMTTLNIKQLPNNAHYAV